MGDGRVEAERVTHRASLSGRPSPQPRHVPGTAREGVASPGSHQPCEVLACLRTDVPGSVPDSPSAPDPVRPRPGRRARPPRRVPRGADPDARPHRRRLDSSAAGDWVSQRVPRVGDLRADEGARRRPRPCRCSSAGSTTTRATPTRTASGSTSAAGTSPTRPATRWSWTGGPGSACAFYRASKAEPMGVELRRRFGFQHGEMTAYEDEDARSRAAAGRGALARSSRRRSSGRASARCATSSPPSSPSRTSSSAPTSTSRSACRAPRAPARPRSACTARRSCSTPTATSSPGRASWWSGPTRPSCATSATCCPRSARSTPSRPRSRSWSARP